MKDRTGFTLLEVAIVIGIFAVILAIALPQIARWQGNNSFQTALQTIRNATQQASALARAHDSQVVLPPGYNPQTAPSHTMPTGLVDELQISQAGTVFVDQHFPEINCVSGTGTGPNIQDPAFNYSLGVVIVVLDRGNVLGPIETFDSSGAPIFTATMTLTNGYTSSLFTVSANGDCLITPL